MPQQFRKKWKTLFALRENYPRHVCVVNWISIQSLNRNSFDDYYQRVYSLSANLHPFYLCTMEATLLGTKWKFHFGHFGFKINKKINNNRDKHWIARKRFTQMIKLAMKLWKETRRKSFGVPHKQKWYSSECPKTDVILHSVYDRPLERWTV